MTDRAPRPPRRRQVQVRLMRVVNVPMRRILGAPFPTPLGKRLMLATLRGRRTGKLYRQPVSYVRDGDALLTPGGGRWTRNLVEGQPVSIRLRGRDVLARPEVVADPPEVQRLLAVIMRGNPAARSFVGLPTAADGLVERQPLEVAIRHGFRVVRWHLGDTST